MIIVKMCGNKEFIDVNTENDYGLSPLYLSLEILTLIYKMVLVR